MKQSDALEILKSGKNVFLTGEPGAGKSHTINLFNAWCETQHRYPDITASTGIAATHINGVTIHSWAGIGIKATLTDYDVKLILQKKYVVDRILTAEILIIDEVSMINGGTLDNVDLVCREVRSLYNMTNRTKPFGGLQVIFVGDFFQLPPVTKGHTLATFAFQSDAWMNADPVVCYITEQHRQEDAEFLDILTSLRAGTLTKEHIARLKKCQRKAPSDITRLFTHNTDVDRVNDEELEKLPGEVQEFRMRESGRIPFMIEILKKNCLSPETLELKIDAPVMFTRNAQMIDGVPGEYVNGTLGKVIGYNKEQFPIVRTKDGREISIQKRTEWSIEEHGETKASIEQVPLRLAWAITVHKCQGMSLDAATMDLSDAFEYGQGYVALSRVRSLSGLYLEGMNAMALKMHPTVVKKDGMFRKISDTI